MIYVGQVYISDTLLRLPNVFFPMGNQLVRPSPMMRRTGILDPQTWNQVVYVLNELLSTVPEMKNTCFQNDWWGKLLVCWLIDSYGPSFSCKTVNWWWCCFIKYACFTHVMYQDVSLTKVIFKMVIFLTMNHSEPWKLLQRWLRLKETVCK